MTEQHEIAAERVVDLCRRTHRYATSSLTAKGVEIEDAAIGALYAAHDVATAYKGGPHDAIEWLRTGLDLMERQLLEQQAKAH
jgi:hypothetical protein